MPENGPPTADSPPRPAWTFVTGNENKRREAERVFGARLFGVDLDLPEIQSLDLEAVLEAKARDAFGRVGQPVIVEEVGLSIDAMGGFPGPLIKWMLDAMGAEGVARVVAGLDAEPTARVVCGVVARADAAIETARLVVEVPGRIVAPRGAGGFGWDPIFVPDAPGGRSYAQLSDLEKDLHGHRGRAWRRLAKGLSAD